jgi:hypothetical protein
MDEVAQNVERAALEVGHWYTAFQVQVRALWPTQPHTPHAYGLRGPEGMRRAVLLA